MQDLTLSAPVGSLSAPVGSVGSVGSLRTGSGMRRLDCSRSVRIASRRAVTAALS